MLTFLLTELALRQDRTSRCYRTPSVERRCTVPREQPNRPRLLLVMNDDRPVKAIAAAERADADIAVVAFTAQRGSCVQFRDLTN